jgi:CDP-glucose 4,6-dehydratase
VIGGGDFSDFRIVPDCIKALMSRQPVRVRNPKSVRPWLNVLDPLSGYLWLGAQLLCHGQQYAQAWNFGPLEQKAVDVQTLVEKAIDLWGEGDWVHVPNPNAQPEMGLLRLNWDKAVNSLGWSPTYHWVDALQQTVDWFKAFQQKQDMRQVSLQHIADYTQKAQENKLAWVEEHILSTR